MSLQARQRDSKRRVLAKIIYFRFTILSSIHDKPRHNYFQDPLNDILRLDDERMDARL